MDIQHVLHMNNISQIKQANKKNNVLQLDEFSMRLKQASKGVSEKKASDRDLYVPSQKDVTSLLSETYQDRKNTKKSEENSTESDIVVNRMVLES